MYCNQCGRIIPDGSRYCNYCGAKQSLAVHAQSNEEFWGQQDSKTSKGWKIHFLLTFAALAALLLFVVVYISSPSDHMPALHEVTAAPDPVVTNTPIAISNGQMLITPGYDCVCPFSVSVTGDNAYYVFLQYIGAPSYSLEQRTKIESRELLEGAGVWIDPPAIDDVAFYIAPHSTVEVDVPIGEYKLYYACGKTWYGRKLLFGDETIYSTSDEHLLFYADSQSYNGVSLELWLQNNGNFETERISADEFPG